MNKIRTLWLWAGCLALLLLVGNATRSLAQTTAPAGAQVASPATTTASTEIKALRELHGIKLNLPRNLVKEKLGKPAQTAAEMDEFKLDGGDLLTVHYGPKGLVKTIQLYCTDAKRAPAWADVIGTTEIQQNANGSKQARLVVPAENFWVTMYQNQAGDLVTVTLSRQQ
jgi:hypothetical protein